MVDRKLLVEDWQQIERALTELDWHEQTSQTRVLNYHKWMVALTRAVWHILEYLIRRDKQ